ncbi:MAG: sigma-70 family RNA polymerase sigma factor [Xenococcaceae cyanobacterium MO_188.B29]|nr:sigma-70 family RNA polymerase sigma factor [Xenococcaceae cyanobacterium MO_188.B29]
MNLEYRDSLPSSNTDLNYQKTDEEIFELFQKGNVDALGVIYDRYGLLVYRLIYRMLNNSQEAEDLTQEIFISLQKKPNYNPQRSSFYTYLMMITRSRTIDRLRSKRYHSSFLLKKDKIKDLIDRQNHVNPLEMATIDERANQVRNALNNLSFNQRRVLELSYYEGLSQSEIAERLNLPLGTVKTHSRRGLLKLKKNLQDLVD